MIIPVRCWSCGKPIAHLWEDFLIKTENKKKNIQKALDELGLERYCCRTAFLGHVDLLDEAAMFKKF
ncbi:DNA-directed RNA polymerase subunit N [Candidatus Woesearchaeota archaeon]|nr:DNA-directed RNA polymerase subunit N [Candidatus Woesearchaeota archaeon]